MDNYNLTKYKNLTIYLKSRGYDIDKITQENAKEILSKFYLINKEEVNKDNESCNCFCGRKLKYYYFIINIENGELLIVGRDCKKIFMKKMKKINIKCIDKDVYNKFIKSFTNGSFVKITDWNEYIKKCLEKYLVSVDMEEYNRLQELYKDNKIISKYLEDIGYNGKKEIYTYTSDGNIAGNLCNEEVWKDINIHYQNYNLDWIYSKWVCDKNKPYLTLTNGYLINELCSLYPFKKDLINFWNNMRMNLESSKHR